MVRRVSGVNMNQKMSSFSAEEQKRILEGFLKAEGYKEARLVMNDNEG